MKIIQKKMPVTHGTIEWNKNIKISYFDQENSQLDFSKTVIDEIHDRRRGMTEQQVRSLLGLVKLTGENVLKGGRYKRRRESKALFCDHDA